MTSPERFERIQEVFHAAVKLSPAAREVFLRDECRADESLRQEIESLLAEDGRHSGFVVTGFPKNPPWPAFVFAIGTRVGPYEISGIIGAGAMGEVYRARDARLRRDVAMKVLPKSFADDPERIRRFRREAKLLASLNHPQIAAIYGLEESNGTLALVMELVEGPTLAERITSGPLSTTEALRYATQIADALEAAHERGIIHRDLKPANVKITPEGAVKILDFGLGKALKPDSGTQDSVDLSAASHAGIILGTAAYMSPEQARGADVDNRADIWAFGVVLYEILTGRRPFAGETTADVLASVVRDEPDLSVLPSDLTAVVTRCLSKAPRNRWGSMGDVRWALDALPRNPQSPALVRRMRYLPWAAAAFFAIAATGAWLWKPRPSQPLLQMEIMAPEGTTLGPVGVGQLALSPDGRRLAFLATGRDGKSRLWLRPLDSDAAIPLPGTENVTLYPFWSPDSRWVGFHINGKLQKIDVINGGPPQLICECFGGVATWNSEGTILFATRDEPIHRVAAAGGKPTPVFGFDSARKETFERGPNFLPDGKHFLYSSFPPWGVVLASLDGKTRRSLGPSAASPGFYAPGPRGQGWILNVDNGQLYAKPFDPGEGKFTGEAGLVANSVGGGPTWSTSANGVLALRHTHVNQSRLTWFDRAGNQLSTLVESGNLRHPRISPDQRTVAFVRTDERNSDIWLFDVTRNTSTRLTSNLEPDGYPAWSSDGRIIYVSQRQDERLLVERAANRAAPEKILLRSQAIQGEANGLPLATKLPTGLSPDGRWIIATELTAGGVIIWRIPRMEGLQPIRFGEGSDGAVSPDGRWLLSVTALDHPEVFVESVPKEAAGPGAAGKWQISMAGGGSPIWRADGKEIFYLAPDGTMMAVPVESGDNFFRPLPPKPLFQTRLRPTRFRDYDVTPDGKHFILNITLADNGNEPITVIVNWPRLLRK
jgi:Tol biopolymer transport system component/tRNA A-37 threonylcarbamoyl transferase component Bud32